MLDVALGALATLERELQQQGLSSSSSSSSQSLLYVEARRLIRDFYQGHQQQQQHQQQQPPGPSPRPSPTPTPTPTAVSLSALEASPLLLAPLLPDILALGCHAAAGVGAQGGQQAPSALGSQAEEEDGPEVGTGAAAAAAAAVGAVPELQLKGVRVLGTLVRLFAGVPDPDAPPEEEAAAKGRRLSVLAQYTSQVTAALAPVLANPLSPALVEAGCGLFFAGLRAGA